MRDTIIVAPHDHLLTGDAGFGENDCEPLSPKIEIVETLLVGVVGLSLEPPPQAEMTGSSIVRLQIDLFIAFPLKPRVSLFLSRL